MIKKFSLMLAICFCTFTAGMATNVHANEINSSNSVIIDELNSGEFINDTINRLIDSGVKNIFIKNGTYKLNNMINIDKPGVTLTGENKDFTKLIQTNIHSDSVGVHKTSNVVVSNLTIDNSVNGDAAFSEGNSDNVTLKNCILYGQDKNNFTVYFAGKDYPNSVSENPVKGLENNDLDNGNIVINNTIYSKFDGDGLSFSAQKNGLVQGNNVYGTKIAVYVCRDSNVINNTIEGSSSSGIAISIPAQNDIIQGNTINNSNASGIRVMPEKEYPVSKSYYGDNITISNNSIKNSKYMGIEIEQLANSHITSNTIDTSYSNGVYMLLTNNITVEKNNILDSGYSAVNKSPWNWDKNLDSGIFMDYSVKKSLLVGNIITNNNCVCPYGIREQTDSLNEQNSLSDNRVLGEFSQLFSPDNLQNQMS